MNPETLRTLVAAAVIMVFFGVLAALMPSIMLALGAWSPLIAILMAVLFVGSFFAVFWLRGKMRHRK